MAIHLRKEMITGDAEKTRKLKKPCCLVSCITLRIYPSCFPKWLSRLTLDSGLAVSDPPDKYTIAVYGQPPPIHIPYLNGISKVDDVDKTLVAREEAIKMLKFYLLRAQNRMKQQADKGRHHKYNKFSPRYYGPSEVIGQIREVAYKLHLPAHATIQNVFHVSQLKKYRGDVPAIDQNVQLRVCDECWVNGSIVDATWEVMEDLMHRFFDVSS
ncbi:hypothetical protein Tco_1485726 [Tanacetum coccineum]